jgi:hypothetical protein
MQRALGFLVLAACTSSVNSIPSEAQGGPSKKSPHVSNNESIAFSYFVNKGLTDVQSAGIIGNLMQESGMDPTIYQYGGGEGRGIAQWNAGDRWDTAAGDNENDFAAQNGEDPWALNTELDFIWWELTNIQYYGLADLQAATNVGDAVYAFMDEFERCGTCAESQRDSFANDALSNLGGGGGGNGGGGGDDGSTTCYSSTLGQDMPQDACVQSASDSAWYQCSDGVWVDRWSDPDDCNGEYPL